jgi:hypothetical protein
LTFIFLKKHMETIFTLKNSVVRFLAAVILLVSASASAQITENFDNIATLPGSGWVQTNNSVPLGTSNWFQGNPAAFVAYNGATNSYIGANFNNVAGANTISNWLIAPNVTLKNGDVFTFRTRTSIDNMWADNLQVRMSTNGTSSNVGVGSAAVGDFTTLLLEINPTLALSTYPMAWTQYTIVISGLSAPTSGRLAFRYYVPNGGPSGANSDYIGIDNFTYTPYVCPVLTVTTATLPDGTAGSVYSQALTSTGPLGTPTYTVTAGSLPPGLTMSTGGVISGTPSGTGTYNFSVTVSDNSGCLSAAQALSITINCPTGGASMSALPTQCSNNTAVVLSEGSPAGGTYSGTGVSGGTFDPAVGTQMITYTLIDVYGCTQMATGTITVNTAPSVTLSPFTAACIDGGNQVLGGGSPAGGTFSGTGVTAGSFDPASGTQNITYSYTDGNGCSGTAMQTFTVNTLPTVTLAPFTPVCSNSGNVALTGGSPAGGVYSGTNVSGGMFDPSGDDQAILYTYTDVNGCSNSSTQPFNVNMAPVVSLPPYGVICTSATPVVLNTGTPAGGTYSGTGVTGTSFDASTVGVYTVTYSVTDVNSCTGTADEDITVSACLGLEEGDGLTNFSCYPNPAGGLFTIQFLQTDNTDISILITNAEGKVVRTSSVENFSGTYNQNFDLGDVESGIYFIEIVTNTDRVVRKIVLQ